MLESKVRQSGDFREDGGVERSTERASLGVITQTLEHSNLRNRRREVGLLYLGRM